MRVQEIGLCFFHDIDATTAATYLQTRLVIDAISITEQKHSVVRLSKTSFWHFENRTLGYRGTNVFVNIFTLKILVKREQTKIKIN